MKALTSRFGGILRSVFTVASFTTLSRLLGLVREMLQSRLIGAGMEQSAFTLAFAIPNLARKLFGEGALTAAFVPVFKGEVEAGRMESARRLARAVMSMAVLMLSAAVLLAVAGMEVALSWGDGFSPRAKLVVELIKTMLPYMVFICAAAFGMGVLNALGRFKASSAMPCLLNVFWIGILVWIWFFPQQDATGRIKMVAIAILSAGAVQLAFMLWRMRAAGVAPRLTFSNWRDGLVAKVWRNTAIAAVGAGAVQINCMLDQVLAQKASPWAAGVIGYAERLMDLPLGVIAVAFGTVLLPTFSGLFAKGDIDAARKAFSSSVSNMMFLMLPAAAGMFVLSPEITSLIYEGNQFDSVATVRVSRALAAYALGLGFFGYQKAIVPWFQAQNDMKTPLKVSVRMVFLNAAMNIFAVFALGEEWRHVGLAVSTVISSAVGAIILTVLAHRRNGSIGLELAAGRILKVSAAALVMALVLALTKGFFAGFAGILGMMMQMAVGAAVYFASIAVLRTRD